MRNSTVEERFWAKVEVTGFCWLWTAATTQDGGYPRFKMEGKTQYAHRIAYQWLVGKVGDGLELDHLCRVRRCVNPDHLEPVEPRTNVLRSFGVARVNAEKTHCIRGHRLEGENLKYDTKGKRYCWPCMRMHQRNFEIRRRSRRLEAAA